MSVIKKISGQEILDSRGNPTVRATVVLADGTRASASAPSGASVGSHEAWELRDKGKRYNGKGVRKAVKGIDTEISRALKGMDIFNQRNIDDAMIALDGTVNKRRLGANAMVAVSMACARAGAQSKKIPLYRYLRKLHGIRIKGWKLPLATINIINGGVHADNGLDVQEFMVVPFGSSFERRVQIGAEVFHVLKSILQEKKMVTSVGDEGGFAPHLKKTTEALQLMAMAVKRAGYVLGKDVKFAMDIAASEFYQDGVYVFEGKKLSSIIFLQRVAGWVRSYPFVSIEDPLHEDDWDFWGVAVEKLQGLHVVGDDFFVTNVDRLSRGIEQKSANAILIKLNQIGTVSETLDAISLAQRNNFAVSVSHRSGETADTFIADLAVGVGADYIKTGSLSRSERVEKYNRLLEIERQL